ncbi:MAG: signal peptidase I [Candidatus Omnitrophota bacterium]
MHYVKYIVIDVIIAAVISIFLINYVASAYKINGSSMQNALSDQERIIISKWAIKDGNIKRGDIVVLRKPDEPDRTIIKRVIGLPGEVIEIIKGDVFINKQPLDESYLSIAKDVMYRAFNMHPLTIPADHYFVMGDNRTVSQDSRFFGPIKRNDIFGVTIFRYWPFSRIGRFPEISFKNFSPVSKNP